MHIQSFINMHPFVLKILRKNTFLHQSRAITLLFINEFSPFAIPNHSFPIVMSIQKFEENRNKKKKNTTRVKSPETKRWRTDGHWKWSGEYNILPNHFFVAGYKNERPIVLSACFSRAQGPFNSELIVGTGRISNSSEISACPGYLQAW